MHVHTYILFGDSAAGKKLTSMEMMWFSSFFQLSMISQVRTLSRLQNLPRRSSSSFTPNTKFHHRAVPCVLILFSRSNTSLWDTFSLQALTCIMQNLSRKSSSSFTPIIRFHHLAVVPCSEVFSKLN